MNSMLKSTRVSVCA